MKHTWLLTLLLLAPVGLFAETRAIIPSTGPRPVGPYSPGVSTEHYLYVSGQGARRPDGSLPSSFSEQVQQTLDNVKSVVEAGGLTLKHVVYAQVYLEDIEKYDEMNRVFARYFPEAPPARATLGVSKLPGTPVEINAVALRDLAQRRVVNISGYQSGEPISAGILTHDRLFISAMRGRELATGKTPDEPSAQVNLALDGMKSVLEAAGLGLGHVVFVNPYLTQKIPMGIMNEQYARRFEFGNTPARATILVTSLPEGAAIEFTGVAVRDLSQRQAVRPKNMAPSPTASPCVLAGDTLYCSAKSGFIPGPNSGIYANTIEHQLRQTMRNLLDGLEEAGMGFNHVVASHVYLDNLDEFQAMNSIYAKYFSGVLPSRTTIQQIQPAERKLDSEGRYPALEQISVVVVKP